MSKEIKLDVNFNTTLLMKKLDAISRHAKALNDELYSIDMLCTCGDCSICLGYDFSLELSECNCKHKGECYKTLGEHGYKVTNCKGLVE